MIRGQQAQHACGLHLCHEPGTGKFVKDGPNSAKKLFQQLIFLMVIASGA